MHVIQTNNKLKQKNLRYYLNAETHNRTAALIN